MAGKFITFEGVDGCGKSTQARRLYENIKSLGTEVILTREPGGSSGAEEIRKLLVTGEKEKWSAETEILLFTAARRDHIEKIIIPALQLGKTVISDRFFDSTRVYQGAVRSDLIEIVDQLHELMIKEKPDFTFIIDTNPKIALERGLLRDSGENRFEEFGHSFQQKLRLGFLNLVKQERRRCHLVDGNKNQEAIAKQILKLYLNRFND